MKLEWLKSPLKKLITKFDFFLSIFKKFNKNSSKQGKVIIPVTGKLNGAKEGVICW